MPATLIAEPLPLHEGSSGTIRVGGSRVKMDTVVHAYECGRSSEEIVESFPTLTLGHVFRALSYCHQNRDEVRRYLERRERQADEVRRGIEARQPPAPTRAALEARLADRRND